MDKWVLSTVGLAYAIHFLSIPPSYPILFRDSSDTSLLLPPVHTLQASGAIEEVPLQNWGKAFYSWYFLIPKSKGRVRPNLNLHCLNKHINYMRFPIVT